MKKIGVIVPVVLLAVFGLLFTGCEEPLVITDDMLTSVTLTTNMATDPNFATNGATQQGLKLSGTALNSLKSSFYVEIKTANTISGGFQIIWQGADTMAGPFEGWHQFDALTGSAEPGSGVTISADKKTVRIKTNNLKDYDEMLEAGAVQFLLAYYSPDIAGLGTIGIDVLVFNP